MAKIDSSIKSLSDLHPAVFQKVGRVTQFDGLRGIFALFVFWYHLWGSDVWAIKDFGGKQVVENFALTPLQALEAGWQFVLAFFILSGFSLMAPVLAKPKTFSWLGYYSSRLIRLYIPAVGSIVVAIFLVTYFNHPVSGPGTEWLKGSTLSSLLPINIQDAFLLDQTRGLDLDAALWSLRWEILFSVVLPLMILALLLILRKLSSITTMILLIAFSGYMMFVGDTPLFYLSVFMIGMNIATNFSSFKLAATKISENMGNRAFTSCGILLAVFLYWFSANQNINFQAGLLNITAVMEMLAAVIASMILMMLSITGSFKSFLNSKVVQFLGKISFSLYLIHPPVLIALAYALPESLWYVHLLVSIPVCLIAAVIFWLLIERPTHRLSRLIKSSVEAASIKKLRYKLTKRNRGKAGPPQPALPLFGLTSQLELLG